MWRGLSLLAATEVGSAMKRSVVGAVIYLVALLCLAVAFGFLVAAGHDVLAEAYGDTRASLILAGLFAAVGAVIMLVSAWIRSRARHRRTLATTAMVVAPAMAPSVVRTVIRHPGVSAGVVAGIVALGAILGRQWGKES